MIELAEHAANLAHAFWLHLEFECDFVVAVPFGLNVDGGFTAVIQVEDMIAMGVRVKILAFFVNDDLMAISHLLQSKDLIFEVLFGLLFEMDARLQLNHFNRDFLILSLGMKAHAGKDESAQHKRCYSLHR